MRLLPVPETLAWMPASRTPRQPAAAVEVGTGGDAAERAIGLDLGSTFTKAVLLGGDGVVLRSLSVRKGGGEAAALELFLDEAAGLCQEETLRFGITGAESSSETGSVVAVNGIVAVGEGVRRLFPGVRSVIEVGAHTAKLVVLGPDGDLRDLATNEACAAGTGSFLEQQARRLGLSLDELSAQAAGAPRAANVAGRCAVFAASDMIHLQQKGTPASEIAYGLCLALARAIVSALAHGRTLERPVAFAGGCARSAGIVRALREALGTGADGLLVSPLPGLEGAVGAAWAARARRERRAEAVPLGEVRRLVRERLAGAAPPRRTLRRLETPRRVAPRPEPKTDEAVEGYLGIDVGSVSTDLVLLDAEGDVVSALYLATRGRPAEVVAEGLALLAERHRGRVTVLGCGVTGSGRHLAGTLVGADVVRNEITCQLLGAQRFFPDVDTVLEIGGQDSKFISLSDGALADFAMNKVCAAGTGSFLEEQSRALGVDVAGGFAPLALSAAAPLDLGSRCTVFMETEVVNALAAGQPVDAICAGLACSIARNYRDKVVAGRPVGSRLVFQGGVASNAAVVAAFEGLLGRPVEVHPYNRVSGAIGAALAARAARAREATPGPSRFRGFAPSARPAVTSFECRHCANRCEVNVVETGVEGRARAYFGDTCERYTSGGTSSSVRVPSLVDEYRERCEALFPGGDPSGLSIGIPRASSLAGTLPFWATFWKELGHRPYLSPPSSQEVLARAVRRLTSGFCLPVKLTIGHVHELLEGDAGAVFVPAVLSLPGADPTRSFACPYTMAIPYLGSAQQERLLSPIVSFASAEAFAEGFEPLLDRLGVSKGRVLEAFRSAVFSQDEIDALMRSRAQHLLAEGRFRYAFAVLGRPYALHDAFVNLGLFERLRRLDVLAVPQGLLPVPRDPALPGALLPWRFPADVCAAAAAVSRVGGLHPVVLTSFGCGPDAFALREVEEALGGVPHLVLELDEHRGEAGLLTRLEAFLDQLDSVSGRRRTSARTVPREAVPLPASPAVVRIPYFADHAHAFCGLFRRNGHDARVLPLPDEESRALGERHSLGKECHAYSMIVGDLLGLAAERRAFKTVFYFPGTSLPCLLHEYGRRMQALLDDFGHEGIEVCSPSGAELIAAFGFDAMELLYSGLLAVELLVKAVCQVRPYEREKGETDAVHRANLLRVEEAVASGDPVQALDEGLRALSEIPLREERGRPVVGLAGDVYTKVNPAANADLVRWLEDQGLEVWPSPFQIDLLDFGISRRLYQSVASLDLPGLLLNGAVALRRTREQWRVRSVTRSRVARREEPGYLEMRRLAAPYMPNEAHELLFVNVAKIVDFARGGADGVVNAICFGCMMGNASAAVVDAIRRDHDGIPIVTAVYAGGDDPSRRIVLDGFVHQVRAFHGRRREAAGTSLASRLMKQIGRTA